MSDLQIPAVFVTLGKGEDGEADGGQAEVEGEQDAHPLAAHFQEVLRLSPGLKKPVVKKIKSIYS